MDNSDVDAHFVKGVVEFRLSNYEQCIRSFSHVRNDNSSNNIGVALMTQG
jgi:hypothetical protein